MIGGGLPEIKIFIIILENSLFFFFWWEFRNLAENIKLKLKYLKFFLKKQSKNLSHAESWIYFTLCNFTSNLEIQVLLWVILFSSISDHFFFLYVLVSARHESIFNIKFWHCYWYQYYKCLSNTLGKLLQDLISCHKERRTALVETLISSLSALVLWASQTICYIDE